MSKRPGLFKSRRDIIWLFGICAALVVPLYFITRAKAPLPPPKPKTIKNAWAMELSPDGRYLASVENVKVKTKETIAEASKEVELTQLLICKAGEKKPFFRYTVDWSIGSALQWSQDSKRVAIAGRVTKIWKAPQFMPVKVPKVRMKIMGNGKPMYIAQQTWLSMDSDIEVMLEFDQKFYGYRLSTGAPLPIKLNAQAILLQSGLNWAFALEPGRAGLTPRGVLVEQLPSIMKTSWHVIPKKNAPKSKGTTQPKSSTARKTTFIPSGMSAAPPIVRVQSAAPPLAPASPGLPPLAPPTSKRPSASGGRPSPLRTPTSIRIPPKFKPYAARISLLELTTGKIVWQRQFPIDQLVPRPLFSPDGKVLVLAGTKRPKNSQSPKETLNRGIEILDSQTGKTRHSLTLGRPVPYSFFDTQGFGFYGTPPIFVVDDRGPSNSDVLRLIDTKTGKDIAKWPKFSSPFSTDAQGKNWIFRWRFGESSKIWTRPEIEAVNKNTTPTPEHG